MRKKYKLEKEVKTLFREINKLNKDNYFTF